MHPADESRSRTDQLLMTVRFIKNIPLLTELFRPERMKAGRKWLESPSQGGSGSAYFVYRTSKVRIISIFGKIRTGGRLLAHYAL